MFGQRFFTLRCTLFNPSKYKCFNCVSECLPTPNLRWFDKNITIALTATLEKFVGNFSLSPKANTRAIGNRRFFRKRVSCTCSPLLNIKVFSAFFCIHYGQVRPNYVYDNCRLVTPYWVHILHTHTHTSISMKV